MNGDAQKSSSIIFNQNITLYEFSFHQFHLEKETQNRELGTSCRFSSNQEPGTSKQFPGPNLTKKGRVYGFEDFIKDGEKLDFLHGN